MFFIFFFFFQAEDGIRDATVTGVQTCALPISGGAAVRQRAGKDRWRRQRRERRRLSPAAEPAAAARRPSAGPPPPRSSRPRSPSSRTFLKRLQRELGTTTVYVTHDQSEALALADCMAVMEAGRVRQLGTPVEVFKRPANLFVARFIGSTPMNLLPATVDGGALRLAGGLVPRPPGTSGLDEGEQVTLGARPEYVA